MAEHNIAALAAMHPSQANQGSQATTVNEIDLRQIQYHLIRIQREFFNFDLESLHLIARNDAALASYNQDVPDSLVL